MTNVLFIQCLYGAVIAEAAEELTKTDKVTCHFEHNPKRSIEKIQALKPVVIFTHSYDFSAESEVDGIKISDYLGHHVGLTHQLKKLTRTDEPLPKLVLVASLDNSHRPLNFWTQESEVFNYIMPPKSLWDVTLPIRQALYR